MLVFTSLPTVGFILSHLRGFRAAAESEKITFEESGYMDWLAETQEVKKYIQTVIAENYQMKNVVIRNIIFLYVFPPLFI